MATREDILNEMAEARAPRQADTGASDIASTTGRESVLNEMAASRQSTPQPSGASASGFGLTPSALVGDKSGAPPEAPRGTVSDINDSARAFVARLVGDEAGAARYTSRPDTVITEQARTPRAGAAAPQSGPATADARLGGFENPPESVTSSYEAIRDPRGGVSAVPGNPDARRELAALNQRGVIRDAVNEQDRRNGFQDSLETARRQQLSFDATNAEQAARVAAFRARDGADMVLATENRGYNKQRNQIIGEAIAADAAAKGLRAQSREIAKPAGNILNETIAGEDAVNRSLTGDVARQRGVIEAAAGREKLDQQKRINQLGNVLATAAPGSPAHTKASQALLSILGKDKPDQYKLHVVQRPDRMGEGMNVLRGGQDLVIVGPDGRPQIVPLGTSEAERPTPPQNHVTALQQNPKLKAEFEKKYGAGSADQYLNK